MQKPICCYSSHVFCLKIPPALSNYSTHTHTHTHTHTRLQNAVTLLMRAIRLMTSHNKDGVLYEWASEADGVNKERYRYFCVTAADVRNVWWCWGQRLIHLNCAAAMGCLVCGWSGVMCSLYIAGREKLVRNGLANRHVQMFLTEPWRRRMNRCVAALIHKRGSV